MAGISDWMVSFSRCDTLIAARMPTAVTRREVVETRGAPGTETFVTGKRIPRRRSCTEYPLGRGTPRCRAPVIRDNREMAGSLTIRTERIERRVLRIRGQHVMLDEDLATLYGVDVKALNQAVKRNRERFPPDFMFRLTAREIKILRSQIVTARSRHGGRRNTPYAFTEQGVAMLSSVLHSPLAIRVNIQIVRAFVTLRRVLESRGDIANRLDELEERYDAQFAVVFREIRKLMTPSGSARARIGFRASPPSAAR